MSDLISRSEVIDILYKVFDEYRIATDKTSTLGGFGSEVFKRVGEMPTVYDIDKVVDELEKASKDVSRGYLGKDNNKYHKHYKAVKLSRAIEIVKQGDVSDDVCEWKRDDTFRWMQAYKAGCCNKILDLTVRMALEMNQCPYCGKKIKVV